MTNVLLSIFGIVGLWLGLRLMHQSPRDWVGHVVTFLGGFAIGLVIKSTTGN